MNSGGKPSAQSAESSPAVGGESSSIDGVGGSSHRVYANAPGLICPLPQAEARYSVAVSCDIGQGESQSRCMDVAVSRVSLTQPQFVTHDTNGTA